MQLSYASSAPRKTRPAFARPSVANSAWPSRLGNGVGLAHVGQRRGLGRNGVPACSPLTPRCGPSWAETRPLSPPHTRACCIVGRSPLPRPAHAALSAVLVRKNLRFCSQNPLELLAPIGLTVLR